MFSLFQKKIGWDRKVYLPIPGARKYTLVSQAHIDYDVRESKSSAVTINIGQQK
jgi:hypothetical protein